MRDKFVYLHEESFFLFFREKVDLTPYVMRHEFRVDYAFDEESSNAEIYRDVVHPLVEACCLRQASTSCFAYGQTGSGKTYTMLGPQPYGRGAEGKSNIRVRIHIYIAKRLSAYTYR